MDRVISIGAFIVNSSSLPKKLVTRVFDNYLYDDQIVHYVIFASVVLATTSALVSCLLNVKDMGVGILKCFLLSVCTLYGFLISVAVFERCITEPVPRIEEPKWSSWFT